VLRTVIDLVRGALIGVAEVIPGVSGGTIALIVGIYETLIGSAASAVRGILALLRGRRGEAVAHLRDVRWRVVVPALVGMGVAIVVGAAVIEPLIEQYPTQSRAVFFGLVVVGVSVPARMVGRWDGRALVLAAAGAAAAFVLTGLPPGTVVDPTSLQIAVSAALAVCALVLPGVSGSFLLLSIGMYEPTIEAVNDLDVAYLLTFSVGAAIGLGSFVMLLQWLLSTRPRVTLIVITGLMAGSLRALWPWQDEDRTLLAPAADWPLMLVLALAGAAAVAALLWAERRLAVVLGDPGLDPVQPSPRSAAE
jgi:putative membrane protein